MSSSEKRDWQGEVVVRTARLRRRTAVALWTRLMRAAAAYNGVVLGANCAFYGRTFFWRNVGAQVRIGDSCVLRSVTWSNHLGMGCPCQISAVRPGSRIVIGNACGFSGTAIAAAESIEIGSRVVCGPNVVITDCDWHDVDPEVRLRPAPPAPVHIEDEVWLGSSVLVLKGVTIGRGSVVAAGSVVQKSIPAGVVAAGRPAIPVREI